MSSSESWKQRLVWIGIGTGFAAINTVANGLFVGSHDFARDHQATVEFRQSDKAQQMFSRWLEIQAQAQTAELLLTRHEGQRRVRPYSLGISSTNSTDEAALFAVMAYFQEAGGLICTGNLDAAELSSYLGAAPRRWQHLFSELRDRSQLPLDGARWEQLLQATTGADFLARRRLATIEPVRLRDDIITTMDVGESYLEARIFNPNAEAVPVPGVCIAFRDSSEVGHWLTFPSEPNIPSLDHIELRGRIPWRANGPPTGIRLASQLSDYIGADAARFPGLHGTMRDF